MMYTMEEINARIDQAERESAAGLGQDSEEMFRELIRKFDWQAETREQLLDRFIVSRPANPGISEEEIMDEVKSVRYAK